MNETSRDNKTICLFIYKRKQLPNTNITFSIIVLFKLFTTSVPMSNSARNLRLPRYPQDSPVKTRKTSCEKNNRHKKTFEHIQKQSEIFDKVPLSSLILGKLSE